ADRKLDRGIHHLHHLCRLGRNTAVFDRRLALHLPRAIHLVAEAPELHIVRLRPAVLAAQVRKRRAAGMVAVLDETARSVGTARAEVHRQHGLDIRKAAPVHELVCAEGVRLDRLPGKVEAARALLHGTYAILPVIARDEIAAGVAHDGGAEFAYQLQHVATETSLIGAGVVRLVNSAIDATAKMFDEGAEQPSVGGADGEVAIEKNLAAGQRILP